MKKISFLFIAAMAMISCGNTYKAHDVELFTMNDSVNYALGLVNGVQIKAMYMQSDSSDAVIAEFVDALQAGYDGEKEKLSEIAEIGKNIGEAIKGSETKVWQIIQLGRWMKFFSSRVLLMESTQTLSF